MLLEEQTWRKQVEVNIPQQKEWNSLRVAHPILENVKKERVGDLLLDSGGHHNEGHLLKNWLKRKEQNARVFALRDAKPSVVSDNVSVSLIYLLIHR
ncbi:hypothetical protein Nepgr_032673 [Nepenthes gracilis]|uniref:Uncharacterized protein n=1 Tax=Nepenthes gracilis TaxID=150966 RepID=A0AAD3TJ27_NEPGR|nr:hypothetical protein Nepgr_032673 [Nepenthes gracilis]